MHFTNIVKRGKVRLARGSRVVRRLIRPIRPRSSPRRWKQTSPAVLKSLAKVVEGTPKVENYEVANSTFHKIAARN